MAGYRHLHAFVLILSVFPVIAATAAKAPAPAPAEPPMVTGVRLGVHPDFTRVVVDFKGQSAPFAIRLADDGLSLQIIAKAGGADGTLPPKHLGLIRDVQWRSVTNGLVVTVAAGTSVSVRGHGTLPPDPSSRFYRIYVDLEPGPPPPPRRMPVAPPEPPAPDLTPEPEPPATPEPESPGQA